MKNRPTPPAQLRRHRLARWSVAAIFASLLATSAHAATYVWNNSTNAWETPGAWTPNGPPTTTDIASFDPTVQSTVVNNPTINATTDVAMALNLNNNFLGGTYSFGGTGTLTLGGPITTRGFGTQTFNGPALAGTTTTALTFNVGTSTGLTLTGATVATTTGALNLNGGTMTLDNSASTTAHLVGATPVSLVGGTLSVLGNAAGTSYSLGAASFNAGFNMVSVTPGGTTAGTTVNFNNVNNSPSGTPTNFSTRTQTYMVEQYVATTGTLGSANGPRVTFTGTPFLGANGLLASSAGGGTVGFATVRDATGTNFATYVAPTATGGGIVAATATKTVTDATGLATLASTDVGQFNPAAAATVTASGAVTSGSLRITPAGAGATLAMGPNQLGTVALMLDGANDFAISGTGLFGGTVSGTRYIYVNNAATTLTTSLVIANGTNPTAIAGPGFVVLNGTASQNTLTTNTGTPVTANRINLLGGVLRANATQLGFNSSGNGLLSLRGGVLEITGGQNGTGASADFTRLLASSTSSPAAFGTVNWANNATTDQGSGGFSAFGSNASVNLGGSATPAGVTWNTGGFVNDGYALRFGSTQSNAVLTFQNPIGLDAGTAGTYAAREINVTRNTTANSGDSTVLSGVLSGSASTDLIKTGTGTLVLSAANTYAGRTFVQGGTLLVNGANSGGGAFVVNNSGSILGGSGTIAGAVTVNAGATLAPGGTASTTGNGTAILGTGNLTLAANSIFAVDLNGATVGTSYDRVGVTGTVTLTGSLLNVTSTFTPAAGAAFVLIDNDGTDAVVGNFASTTGLPTGYGVDYTYDLATGALTGGNDVALVPVPEPGTVFGGILLVGALGWNQRRRLQGLLAARRLAA